MKIRTNKELIKIALDNFDTNFSFGGLCAYFINLTRNNIINEKEEEILIKIIEKYIKENTFWNNIFYSKNRIKGKKRNFYHYYWNWGESFPRKKYLEYLLKRV